MSPANALHGIVPCVVTDPELGLCAASGHSSTVETLCTDSVPIPTLMHTFCLLNKKVIQFLRS